MSITAAMIKELRERSGAGMMDCKKILTETNGDIDLAIEELRKSGAAAAAKKAGRIAAEGVIVSAVSGDTGVLVEINCETDFVAKDESYLAFADSVAATVLAQSPADVQDLSEKELAGESIEASRQGLISKIGEKISVRRFVRMTADGGVVGTYLHGNRIGVMVKLSGGDAALGKDVAMHIAASRPLCISADEMDDGVLAREKEIFVAQAAMSGKPAEIIEKMVAGRVAKFLKENTLLGQPFVKNPEQTVAQLLADAGGSVLQMVRFEVGEGIEKRHEDFVAEVMAQAGA